MRWSWWNNWESFHFSTHAPIFSPQPLHLPVFSNLLFSFFLLSYFLSLFLPPPKQAFTYGCEPRCAYFHRIIHPMLIWAKRLLSSAPFQMSLCERSWWLWNAKQAKLKFSRATRPLNAAPGITSVHFLCSRTFIVITLISSRIPKMTPVSVDFFRLRFLPSSKTVSQNM